MRQQHLDYESPLRRQAGLPVKRIVALASVLSVTAAYDLLLAHWKVTATVPGPVSTFIDNSLAPYGNSILGCVAANVTLWLPVRGWRLLGYLALSAGVPFIGWLAVAAVR